MPNDDGIKRHTPGEPRQRLTPLPRPVGVDEELPPRPESFGSSTIKPDPNYIEIPPPDPELVAKKRTLKISALVVLYVVLALGIDALASKEAQFPFNWEIFRWNFGALYGILAVKTTFPVETYHWMQNPLLQRIDLFKLIFWLILPFIVACWNMEWAYWRTLRWKNVDLWSLAGITAVGMLVMFSIKYIPDLQAYYPSRASLTFPQKVDFVVMNGFWILSWLIGYEFLHRYVLLRRLELHWPKFGWLAVPFFDAAYHLTKSEIEMLAMFFFAILLTWWASARRNLMLPLCAHFIIEVELIIFLLFF